MATAVITANTRASAAGVSTTFAPPLRLAGASDSFGQTRANTTPQPARDGEGIAPAQPLDEQARDQSGARNAEIAGQAVEPDDRARVAGVLYQHGDAHRVIDRRKGSEQGERDAKLQCVLRDRNEQGRRAESHEEDDHHAASTPDVAESPGGHGAEAEHEECAHRVGHEVGPVRIAEFGSHGGDCGGEDQQEHVIDRVAEVQQIAYDAREGAR
jgi:hypothetical protein